MHVSLDGHQWEVSDEVSLVEALATVSDKAHAAQRIVTSLIVGGKLMNDRDLIPTVLNQPLKQLGPIVAVSQSLHAIIHDAKQAIDRFAGQLKADGQALLRPLRAGVKSVGAIDGWLGMAADYVEMLEVGQAQGVSGLSPALLMPWMQELLAARSAGDAVRMADVLEYEIFPRLTGVPAAA